MTASVPQIDFTELGPERRFSQPAKRIFVTVTSIWVAATVSLMVLFYVGVLDFINYSRLSMYFISTWLNVWILVWFMRRYGGQNRSDFWHDLLVVWMLCYAITNIQWEIPWVLFSPFVFENIHTLEDMVAQTDYMRETPWPLLLDPGDVWCA